MIDPKFIIEHNYNLEHEKIIILVVAWISWSTGVNVPYVVDLTCVEFSFAEIGLVLVFLEHHKFFFSLQFMYLIVSHVFTCWDLQVLTVIDELSHSLLGKVQGIQFYVPITLSP